MAIPTQIETFVDRKFIPKLVDNVTHFDYLFERLWKNRIPEDGGRGIEQPLKYGENGNVGTYQPHGDFMKNVPEVVTYAYFNWTNYYANILASRIEGLMDKGSAAKMLNMIKVQIESGDLSLRNRLGYDLVGDGKPYTWPAKGGQLLTPMQGLKKIMTADNTYGGIDASAEVVNGIKWWNPDLEACAAYNGGANKWDHLYTAGNAIFLPELLRKRIGSITDGADQPSIGIMPQNLWNALWMCYHNHSEQHITEVAVGVMGFKALNFDGIDFVVNKKHMPGEISILNETYLDLHTLSGASLDWTGFNRTAGDSDMGQVLLTCAMTCSNRQKQGGITGLPTDYTKSV